MIKLNIENQIRQQVAESIDIESESDELFKIVLPFTYSDGDQLLCFLENGDGGWFATDDGGAFSHAFDLGVNLDSENRIETCLLYTSPSPRDATLSRMPSSA